MKTKFKVRLTLACIFSAFLMILITMVTEAGICILLLKHRMIESISISTFTFILLISIMIGTLANAFLYKKILFPIEQLNKAMKEISQGNFSVRMHKRKNAHISEIMEMTDSFNLMAEELSNKETFHNDFINNVSHEFKTPLAAIEGYVTLLQDAELSEEERKKYVETIIFNTKRLSKLTSNILELSRFDNQKIAPKQNTYSLSEQIRQVVLTFEQAWSDKNIELDIDLEEVMIYGVESWTADIWSNLIDNAIKYSGEEGLLSIKMVEDKEKVIVKVKDSGIGMDENTVNHIFDKFYQADSSHKTVGNGLGLALVKRIVDICKGEILVDSELGAGSTFTVILPKKTEVVS